NGSQRKANPPELAVPRTAPPSVPTTGPPPDCAAEASATPSVATVSAAQHAASSARLAWIICMMSAPDGLFAGQEAPPGSPSTASSATGEVGRSAHHVHAGEQRDDGRADADADQQRGPDRGPEAHDEVAGDEREHDPGADERDGVH